MGYEMSSLDLHFIVKELERLAGARLDKVYNPEKKELLLQIFQTGIGKKIVRVQAPGFIYLTDYKGDQPEKPSGFCTYLRKQLEGSRLRGIRQLEFERIIEVSFESGKGKLRLMVELFSKGNMVLCDEAGMILMAAENQAWKERTIKPKLKYEYPKKGLNFLEMGDKELRDSFNKAKKSLVRFLAVDMGLGGVYAEELCARAELKKDIEELDEASSKRIIKERERLLNGGVAGEIITEGDKLKAITPFTISMSESAQAKKFESYNEALDYAFTNELTENFGKEKLSGHDEKIEKIRRIIAKQEEYLAELEQEIVLDSAKGERIYQKYQELDAILRELAKAREKFSFKEIKEKLKGHKLIKDIKEKEKVAVLEIE